MKINNKILETLRECLRGREPSFEVVQSGAAPTRHHGIAITGKAHCPAQPSLCRQPCGAQCGCQGWTWWTGLYPSPHHAGIHKTSTFQMFWFLDRSLIQFCPNMLIGGAKVTCLHLSCKSLGREFEFLPCEGRAPTHK